MTPIYTRTYLKARLNARIKGKIGVLADANETCNEAVRFVVGDIDIRSMRRQTPLSPPLFKNIFEYVCPNDLKDYKIIDIDPQTDRRQNAYELVPFEEFGRRRDLNTVAISDNDFIRKILVNAHWVNGIDTTISTLDTVTAGGGTWVAFGDGTNLTADSDNYVRENGSINWDISGAGGTTAGIQNTGLANFDLTSFLGGNGSVFVWHYITSVTNITNLILRIGSSSSNYYQKTVTSRADGTAFANGWNLIRFDLTSLTTVGSPVNASCNFVAIYMTKTSGKINETDYRFDSLILKKGEIHNVVYYSKFGWQSSSGAYKENSTTDTDLLNVDTTEFGLMLEKAVEIAGEEVDEIDASNRAAKRYGEMKKSYTMSNPSEAKLMISTYADFIKMSGT